MGELRNYIINFSNITNSIITCLENEEYDKLEDFINNRQIVIDKINIISFSKKEFYDLCNEFSILGLQNKCNKTLEAKRTKIREELKKISVNKNLNKQYSYGTYVDSIYFNKKI